MSIDLDTQIQQSNAVAVSSSSRSSRQVERIQAAFGLTRTRLPLVNAETLSQYYHFLAKNLLLPFAACYPQPKDAQEAREFRCEVEELIDPARYLGEAFEGLHCKTSKGGCELSLPLIDLYLPENHRNFQLIEDYWFWFWNWR